MEGVACMAGVVAVVLPPGEQVLVPRPRHRTGGKGSAELVAPGGQPAEPEPRVTRIKCNSVTKSRRSKTKTVLKSVHF